MRNFGTISHMQNKLKYIQTTIFYYMYYHQQNLMQLDKDWLMNLLTLILTLSTPLSFSGKNFKKTLFPQIFMNRSIQPNFDMGNSKIKLIFSNFLIFIFIFPSISQKCLKKWVKNFVLRF